MLILGDCITEMKAMEDNSVDMTLTDIPYGEVSRKDNGLRNLNKGDADILTFDLNAFLNEVTRVTKGTVIIFCARGQMSHIHNYFDKQKNGTVRQGIWQKTNPMPSNGQYIYLSGIENFIWYKKPRATFNAHCKNPIFKYPNGSSKLHPTEKNHELLKELILDNSNEGDLIFDPCFGSGSSLLVAEKLGRKILGIEIKEEYYEIANMRVRKE